MKNNPDQLGKLHEKIKELRESVSQRQHERMAKLEQVRRETAGITRPQEVFKKNKKSEIRNDFMKDIVEKMKIARDQREQERRAKNLPEETPAERKEWTRAMFKLLKDRALQDKLGLKTNITPKEANGDGKK